MRTTIDWHDWPSVIIGKGLTALLALASALALTPIAAAASPSDLPGAAEAQQIVVVTSTNFRSTRARLNAYEKSPDGRWVVTYRTVTNTLGRACLPPGGYDGCP